MSLLRNTGRNNMTIYDIGTILLLCFYAFTIVAYNYKWTAELKRDKEDVILLTVIGAIIIVYIAISQYLL